MFFELFVLGGLMWWIMVVAASILIIWALEEENGSWATTAFIGAILLWQFCGDLRLQDSIDSWWNALGLFLGYIGVGVTWSFIKWHFFVGKKKEEYEDMKIDWLKDHGVYDTKEVPESLKAQFRSFLCQMTGWYERRWVRDEETGKSEEVKIPVVKPRAQNNKARIARWMAYWPWSMLWSLLDDVWHKIFRWAQRAVADVMNAISDWRFKGVEDDFTVKESEPESRTKTQE